MLAAGCQDDRKRVAGDVFFCDPSSHSADYDCGDGYRCYSANQSFGQAVCVPQCDPARAEKTCPGGACTVGHECLTRCKVDPTRNTCSDHLSCVRATYSPLEAASGKDGVCVPANDTCSETDECGGAVFNLCTSETNGQQGNEALLKSGSVCAQGSCAASGVACEPGSSCIQKVLPAANMAPDVCTPNCQQRELPDKSFVYECPVGFTCLNEAFPQTTTRVCGPGFPGWICKSTLGCTAGTCTPWTNVGGVFDGFSTCAPKCESDADCLIYDDPREGNPRFYSHFTCVGGQCRRLASMLFTANCIKKGAECPLDPGATCGEINPPPGQNDGGSADDGCGFGGLGPPLICTRECTDDAKCATLSQGTHVTYACVNKQCVPSLPLFVPCTDDSSCMPGLQCKFVAGGMFPTCSLACSSTADCASHPALGSNFVCVQGNCIAKIASGCSPPAPVSELCLSGALDNSAAPPRCASPKGWVCDRDQQCLSGICLQGHCQ